MTSDDLRAEAAHLLTAGYNLLVQEEMQKEAFLGVKLPSFGRVADAAGDAIAPAAQTLSHQVEARARLARRTANRILAPVVDNPSPANIAAAANQGLGVIDKTVQQGTAAAQDVITNPEVQRFAAGVETGTQKVKDKITEVTGEMAASKAAKEEAAATATEPSNIERMKSWGAANPGTAIAAAAGSGLTLGIGGLAYAGTRPQSSQPGQRV